MEVNTMQTEYILKAMDAALAAGTARSTDSE